MRNITPSEYRLLTAQPTFLGAMLLSVQFMVALLEKGGRVVTLHGVPISPQNMK